MPIYAYKCNKCPHSFDDYQDTEDRATARCPKCKEMADKDFEASLPRGKGIVLNNELIADFDGTGEKTYTRRKYIDKCKELGREPEGLLFR